MKNRGLTTNAKKRKAKRPLRIDPTRTGTLRKRFVAQIRKRFALLRLEVRKLVEEEDAFGLKPRKSPLANVFCATGEGGGVDPSCSPADAKAAMGKHLLGAAVKVPLSVESSPPYRGSVSLTAADRAAAPLVSVPIDRLTATQSTTRRATVEHFIDNPEAGEPPDVVRVGGKLYLDDGTHRTVAAKFRGERSIKVRLFDYAAGDSQPRPAKDATVNAFCPTGEGGGIDPTCSPGGAASVDRLTQVVARIDKEKQRYGLVHLADVRAAFPKLSKAEFDRAIQDARKAGKLSLSAAEGRHGISEKDREAAIHEKDFTGGSRALVYVSVRNVLTANAGRWAYASDPEKVKQFRDWLRRQMAARLRGQTEEQLWQRYVEEGFRKGAGRAFDDVNRSRRAGDDEKLDFYQGSRQQFLRDSFGRPESVDKVKLLAGRSFSDLEGITEDTSLRMTRILTDGLVQGKNPRDIARDLDGQLDLGRKRAETIARSEIIRSHASGQLMALEELGVEEVGVAVEFSSAGDDRVCDRCASLEGVVLKLAEAQGMIPVHPNCRCSWIPSNVGEDSDTQKRTKDSIEKAIRSAKDDDDEDGWGPGEPISKDRPESIFNEAFDGTLTDELRAISRFLSNEGQ